MLFFTVFEVVSNAYREFFQYSDPRGFVWILRILKNFILTVRRCEHLQTILKVVLLKDFSRKCTELPKFDVILANFSIFRRLFVTTAVEILSKIASLAANPRVRWKDMVHIWLKLR